MKRRRLQVFRFLLVSGFAIVFFRAVQVQIFFNDRLSKWARHQEREVSLKGPRGRIRDREGRDLAVSVETLSFFADPSEIENPKKFADAVAPVLQLKASDVESKIQQNKSRRFVWLKRQVDRSVRASFEALKKKEIEGLGVLQEYRREYPHGDVLAQVLGKTSIDGEGIEGVERDFEEVLQGGVSVVRVPRDARGRLFYVDKNQLLSKGESGKDVDLTIDIHLQSLVESAVDSYKKKYSADSALTLVVDPLTGEILVWAQSPRTLKGGRAMRNIALTDPIEPGSVVKPLLMAWGIERNVVHEKTIFDSPGGMIQVADKLFKDPLKIRKTKNRLTPEEILKYSSNVGAVRLGQRLGSKDIWTLFEKMGFVEKTGLGLSGESRGILKKPRDVQKVEYATMSFGQGFAITPLQLIRAFTVIAGDGHLRTLKISKEAAQELHPDKVLNPKTLSRIRKLMESALGEGGTAINARVEGYTIAGKTGTSQKSEGKKGYAEDRYYTSFVGFIPSDEPKYLIYSAFDNPKVDVITGGNTAAPLFAEVARLCLRNEEPDAVPIVDAPETPLKVNPVLRDLAQDAPESKTHFSDSMNPNSEAALTEVTPPGTVPNLVGEHLRQALERTLDEGFEVRFKGQGHYVGHQYPPAGTYAKKNRKIVLFLK